MPRRKSDPVRTILETIAGRRLTDNEISEVVLSIHETTALVEGNRELYQKLKRMN